MPNQVDMLDLLCTLTVMCAPDPPQVLAGSTRFDRGWILSREPAWLPYRGECLGELVAGLERSGCGERGMVVAMRTTDKVKIHQAVRLTRKGREEVERHEALAEAGRREEAAAVLAGIFGRAEDARAPRRNRAG